VVCQAKKLTVIGAMFWSTKITDRPPKKAPSKRKMIIGGKYIAEQPKAGVKMLTN
jgi:hypothetical protein